MTLIGTTWSMVAAFGVPSEVGSSAVVQSSALPALCSPQADLSGPRLFSGRRDADALLAPTIPATGVLCYVRTTHAAAPLETAARIEAAALDAAMNDAPGPSSHLLLAAGVLGMIVRRAAACCVR
jgi:hypothetical protein